MATFPNPRYDQLLKSVGKAGLNALFPNDFEYYLCALELVDSEDKIIDYFAFPIMPRSIREVYNEAVNIKKTLAGISILHSSGFIPVDIEISGTFGRQFKFLVGRKPFQGSAIRFSSPRGNFKPDYGNVLSDQLKTGYGCFKVLESIINKANILDEKGRPYYLYFYNPAIGNSYMVVPINLTKSQTEDRNMLWDYSLSLKAVAPISIWKNGQKGLQKSLLYDNVQKGINKTLGATKDFLFGAKNSII